MARKRSERQKVTPGKVASSARNNKTRSLSTLRRTSRSVNIRKLRDRQGDTRARSLNVAADLRRNPKLSFTQAAHKRHIDPRTVRKKIPSAFRKDPSGRIKVRPTDRYRQTLYIPSHMPGEEISVVTKNSRERQIIGRWMSALNYAKRGDFSKIRELPPNPSVRGVRLPTGPYEVQRILNALAERERPFEGLYRTLAISS